MRSFIIPRQRKEGRRSVNWRGLLVAVFAVPALVIGSIEALWYALTGEFSPLVGGFALIASILIVIRLVGEALTRRSHLVESYH